MTPLTVLGGYLGAGKTTIINGLLTRLSERGDNPRIAVLVNDFGSINIDARLIKKHSGRTLELTSGCVCCDIQDDLGSALEALRSETFEQVLIETSGVAYPAKVADYAVTWPGYRPGGILVAVDALNINCQQDDKFIGHLVNQQIAEADLLLVTKLDQLDPEHAQSSIDMLSKRAVRVDNGHCNTDILIASASNTVGHGQRTATDSHVNQFHTFSYQTDRVLDHRQLEVFFNELPVNVIRAKGWVHDNEGTWWLQSVGDRWSLDPSDGLPGGTSLVFIALANTAHGTRMGELMAGLERTLQQL